MEPVFIQILSVLPGLNYFANFYREVIPDADLRTADWSLMSSPDTPASIVLAYLCTVVFVGPSLMRYLKIPWIRELLIFYNSIVLVLNLWLGVSFTWHIVEAGYNLSCQRVGKPGLHEDSIASLLWIFHCSKIVELIDTLFLVFKKKGNQLTFLHLYHHSTIVIATWMGVKFVPGGSSAVIAMVNSWVHVFMYFYYEMMVLGVKSFHNYKKFVTIMQIVQFLATIVHCSTGLKTECGYPRWILTWLLLYMISFLVLFVHFYVRTYWNPRRKTEPSNGNCQATSKTSLSSTPSKNHDVVFRTRKFRNCNAHVPFSDDDDEPEINSIPKRGIVVAHTDVITTSERKDLIVGVEKVEFPEPPLRNGLSASFPSENDLDDCCYTDDDLTSDESSEEVADPRKNAEGQDQNNGTTSKHTFSSHYGQDHIASTKVVSSTPSKPANEGNHDDTLVLN